MKQNILGALLIALFIITVGAGIAAIDISAGSPNLGITPSKDNLAAAFFTFGAGLFLTIFVYRKMPDNA